MKVGQIVEVGEEQGRVWIEDGSRIRVLEVDFKSLRCGVLAPPPVLVHLLAPAPASMLLNFFAAADGTDLWDNDSESVPTNKFALGQEPWSRGFGRRLMFQRSWVRIPAPYTGWTFFHIYLFEKTK